MNEEIVKEAIKTLKTYGSYDSKEVQKYLYDRFIKKLSISKSDIVKVKNIIEEIENNGGIKEYGERSKIEILNKLLDLFPYDFIEDYSNDYYSKSIKFSNDDEDERYIVIVSKAECPDEILKFAYDIDYNI